MTMEFRHHQNGRRPLTWLATAAGFGFVAVMLVEPAPLVIWAIVTLYLGACLWMILWNPQSGLALTNHHLRVHRPGQILDLQLCQIERANWKDWSDGPGDWSLLLRDGRTVDLPSTALPDSRILARELELRGIPIHRT
jgi:hypothetical protein